MAFDQAAFVLMWFMEPGKFWWEKKRSEPHPFLHLEPSVHVAFILHPTEFFFSGGCEHVSPALHPESNVRDEPFPWEKKERHPFRFLQEETGIQRGQLIWRRPHSLAGGRTSPFPYPSFGWRICTLTASAEMAGLSFAFFPCTEPKPYSHGVSSRTWAAQPPWIWRLPASPLVLN